MYGSPLKIGAEFPFARGAINSKCGARMTPPLPPGNGVGEVSMPKSVGGLKRGWGWRNGGNSQSYERNKRS